MYIAYIDVRRLADDRCRFGGGQQRPPRTVEVPLKLTLKELYTGTTKRLKITRRVYNKQTGKLEPKEVCASPI